MDSKKNSNVNLERYRFTFLLIGLTLSLGLVILIFQWKSFEPNFTKHLQTNRVEIETELPPTFVLREEPIKKEKFSEKKEERKAEPKKKPKKVIKIVSNPVKMQVGIEPVDSFSWGEPKGAERPEPMNFLLVEKKPVFPGCEGLLDKEQVKCFEEQIMKHILNEVRYPSIAWENRVEEKIILSFLIDEKGEVTSIEVVRGKDKALKKESIRVMKTVPKMASPALQRGKPVPVLFSVPISFKLQ